jgi:hypothetical protein
MSNASFGFLCISELCGVVFMVIALLVVGFGAFARHF